VKVVTSSGDFLTVNSHKHSDLFWALRGGGGGTYGVVVSVTYRTHPSTAVTAIYIEANSTNTQTFTKFFTEFIRIHTNLSDLGFGGYLSISPSPSNLMNAFYIAPNVTQEQANKTIDPFFAFAQNLTSEGLNIAAALTVPYPSWYAWYKLLFSTGQPQVGFISEMASRLISRDTFENNPQGIAEAVLALNGAGWT
jgi:hypothetical protein